MGEVKRALNNLKQLNNKWESSPLLTYQEFLQQVVAKPDAEIDS